MPEQFSNGASTTLSANITTTTATSVSVTSAANFPATGTFRIMIDSELMIVTGVAGNVFTVTRGQEGTTAATHNTPAPVNLVITAAQINGGGVFARTDVATSYTADQRFGSGKPWFDVTSATFGATGNGTTDDTAAINAALAAVPSTGGVVYCPPGRYKISSSLLVQKDNTSLIGGGAGLYVGGSQPGVGTRFEFASGIATAGILVQGAANTTPVYGVILRDFTVDGRSTGTAVDGVLFRSDRGYAENVHTTKCTGNGFVIRGYTTGTPWATYDTVMIRCESYDNSLAGFYMVERGEDLHFLGCLAHGNGTHGWNITSASEQITNCHAYDNGANGFHFDGGVRTKILGCKIEGNRGGIYADGGSATQMIVVGNGFKDNSRDNNNVYDNIYIGSTGGTRDAVITGNHFMSTIATKVRYHVNLANTNATNTLVIGNAFDRDGTATAMVNNGGSTSAGFKPSVRQNMGYITEENDIATVPDGSTSVVVTHRLSKTPNLRDIQVTPTNSMGSATKFWVSSPTSTTFTINVNTNPGATTATFAWLAQILYGT